MLKFILGKWDFWIAIVSAEAAAWFIHKAELELISADLITIFGIQSAVILPAMILTAGMLRPDGLSLSEAKRYGRALQEQMSFWAVLLAFDFATVVLLILGKGTAWMSSGRWSVSTHGVEISASTILISIVAFVGVWALLRTIPFVMGVLSLQRLNSDLIEKAIAARDTSSRADPSSFKAPEGFGRVVPRR